MRAQSWTHALALRVLTPTHQGTDPAKDLSIQRLPLRCPLLPVGNGSHWGEGGGAQILLKSDLAGAYTKWTSQPTCARHFTIPTLPGALPPSERASERPPRKQRGTGLPTGFLNGMKVSAFPWH